MVNWRRTTTEADIPPTRGPLVRMARRALGVLLATGMWLLLAVAVLIVGLVASSSLRNKLLDTGLDRALGAVPGVLEIGAADWAELGHLKFTDVVWLDDQASADTLAHVALLDLHLDLAGLRHRDVGVDSLRLVVPQLNVPALVGVLAAAAPDPADQATVVAENDSTTTAPFPRPGSLPGAPSVALSHWRVELGEAILTPELRCSDLTAAGALEARAGRPATAVISNLDLKLIASLPDTVASQPLVMALTSKAELGSTNDHFVGQWECEFVLPGASDLKLVLPDEFPHQDFGPIRGRLVLDGGLAAQDLALAVDLDLAATPWLGAGKLAAHLEADISDWKTGFLDSATIAVDSLAVSLLGAELQAVGKLQQENLELSLQVAVADSQLASLLVPGAVAHLDLAAQVAGTLDQPTADIALEGDWESSQVIVPRLVLHAAGGANGGRVDLHLPAGVQTPEAQLDSLTTQLQVSRDLNDVLAAQFSLATWRDGDYLATGGQAWLDSLGRGSTKKIQVDSLVVAGLGQVVRLQDATVLTWGPGVWDIDLSPLVLAAEPGEVAVGGHATPSDLDLAARLALHLPEDLLMTLFPSDFWTADGGRDFSLAANVDLQGTRADPTLSGRVKARLIPHRDDDDLGLDVKFALAAGDSAGLQAELALVAADSSLLVGSIEVPGRLDPQTGAWQFAEGRPAQVLIPEQAVGLAPVNRLLPPEVSLAGELSLAMAARLPLGEAASEDGSVTGSIRAPHLAVSLPNRSRLDAEVDMRLDGTLNDPVIGGRITIKSGFFRIPELPRTLHPTEGAPLLWSLVDSTSAVPDSLLVFIRPESQGPLTSPQGPALLPDLDLEILIPGNLRLHGYGLDMELAGDLQVSRVFDPDSLPQPSIQGEVHAVQGSLQFMNHVFGIERAEVNFGGAVPPDPVLDMQLEADVSGILVRIDVSGVASNPVIGLSSEPDYEEQDIMAVLLFGQPLSELDNDQRGGVEGQGSAGQELRQNLAGLAMAFGTAGLQNSVSNTFGVDMVEMGSGSAGDNTLMVGKFINPKLMLKYHHSLEKSGTYFLTMEYALSRIFKIVTTYGQGEEDSGMELKWTRRY